MIDLRDPAADAASVIAASGLGAWSLCCCVVAPAFQFEGFELAAPGWEPGAAGSDWAG